MANVAFVAILVIHAIVMDHVQLVKVHSQPTPIVITNVSHVQYPTVRHVAQPTLLNVKLVLGAIN